MSDLCCSSGMPVDSICKTERDLDGHQENTVARGTGARTSWKRLIKCGECLRITLNAFWHSSSNFRYSLAFLSPSGPVKTWGGKQAIRGAPSLGQLCGWVRVGASQARAELIV